MGPAVVAGAEISLSAGGADLAGPRRLALISLKAGEAERLSKLGFEARHFKAQRADRSLRLADHVALKHDDLLAVAIPFGIDGEGHGLEEIEFQR